MVRRQKTPEINELEPAYKIMKIWARNFEKQQSYSKTKFTKADFFSELENRGRTAFKQSISTDFIFMVFIIFCKNFKKIEYNMDFTVSKCMFLKLSL